MFSSSFNTCTRASSAAVLRRGVSVSWAAQSPAHGVDQVATSRVFRPRLRNQVSGGPEGHLGQGSQEGHPQTREDAPLQTSVRPGSGRVGRVLHLAGELLPASSRERELWAVRVL